MNKTTPQRDTQVSAVERPWALSSEEIIEGLEVSPEQGLSAHEARRRRQKYGPNTLREAKKKSLFTILVDQFESLMILLLVIAAAVALLFKEWIEGIAIGAVIVINTAIGFFTEVGAVRSMEALRRMTKINTRVRRNGDIAEIPADQLVPGDVVVVEGGDIITADLRLIQASKLQADESTLTGESVPVSKNVEPIEADAPLADRKNMLFKGTAVTRGSGEGIVVSTGMATELGHISALVEEAEEEPTPLEKRLDQLGKILIWVTLFIAVVVAASGIVAGKDLLLMIETAIALAVAAVPEGLPIVATIALARGMYRMSRRNAVINRLSAVESLGSTSIIFTDKTGTLTENQMTVTKYAFSHGDVSVGSGEHGPFKMHGGAIEPARDRILSEALEVGALCNNASLAEHDKDGHGAAGDPLEIALLEAARRANLRRRDLIERQPELREEAFESDTKMMATFHKFDGRLRVAVKGAPEAVITLCSSILLSDGTRKMTEEDSREWLERNDQLAQEGLRVLALATKVTDSLQAAPYDNLIFIGLVGLLDPPRKEVADAVALCRKAGIRVIMATGDQPVTASNVGAAVGLAGEKAEVVEGKNLRAPEHLSQEEQERLKRINLFARVSPKQKLDLIALHQQDQAIVAMTGDGVNDAPALKKADIGVAMGKRGTQVAREASDMILKDDSFSTIVAAVEQARIIFNNIRKFIIYLLSCNVSEILVVSIASLARAPLPLLPLQILFLNLVTDVFPALALGVGEGDPKIMSRPPRDPREPLLTRRNWTSVVSFGLLITLAVLAAFAIALLWFQETYKDVVTVSFLTLAFAQLWHVFNMRDPRSGIFKNEITRNIYIWGALAICISLLLLAVFLPVFALVLHLTAPDYKEWLLIVGMSLVPLVIGQVFKRFL